MPLGNALAPDANFDVNAGAPPSPYAQDIPPSVPEPAPVQAPPAAAPGASPPAAAPVKGLSYPGGGQQDPALQQPQLAPLPGARGQAGWLPSSEQTTSKTAVSYSPETLGSIGEALGTKRDLAGAKFAYENKLGQYQAHADRVLSAFDQASGIANDYRAKHQLAAAAEYHAKIDALQQDAANDKEDPYKWFHSQPTGAKIATALAMAVAGFGYGYSGRGTNPLELVNSMVKQSTDEQRSAHNNKLQNIEGKINGYGRLKEFFGDEDRASLASQMLQRQTLVGDLQAQASDFTRPEASRQRAAQYADELAQMNASTLKELDEKTAHSIETVGKQEFHAPSAAGSSIGVQVTTADGKRVTVPIATAKELGMLPKEQLELATGKANLRKTEAETKKLENKGADNAQSLRDVISMAPEKSTSLLENPGAAVSRAVYETTGLGRDTAGAQMSRADQIRNEHVEGIVGHQVYGIRNPEQREKALKAVLYSPGDSAKVRAEKDAYAIKLMKGDTPQEQAGPGAVPE